MKNEQLKTIVFRFNAGSFTGLGHWYRCLTLIDELKSRGNLNIVLFINPLNKVLSQELIKREISFIESPYWSRYSKIKKKLLDYQATLLIIDILNIQKDYMKKLTNILPVITIGGSGNGRNYSTVRIDGMIPRSGYTKGFAGEKLYEGPEYIILRKAFLEEPQVKIRKKVERILITLGGDTNKVGINLAKKIAFLFPKINIDVLVGPITKTNHFPSMHNIILHKGIDNPRYLMEQCDIAITSGGMTTYELFRLGIPVILFPQTPLQDIASKTFEGAGAGFKLPIKHQFSSALFEKKLLDILETLFNKEVRLELSQKGKKIVDGKGFFRVADIIEYNLKL